MTLTTTPTIEVLPAESGVQVETNAGVTKIHVPAGREASLLETYESLGADRYQREARIQITLDDNARLTHYKRVQEGPKADHHSFIEVQAARSAVFDSHVFLFGGARIRNTIHVRLAGEGSECSLNGLYLGTGEQVIETHTLIDHVAPHGTSREFYKGILDQKSHGLFDGLIVVQKEGQQTDSSQTNKNLLLSSEARAKSNPELKIFANDVKCKHGSTIGQIDPVQLFYLRSRGIRPEEARKLLILAFASDMIHRVPLATVRESLEPIVTTKFQGV